jgi:hypothetical protein
LTLIQRPEARILKVQFIKPIAEDKKGAYDRYEVWLIDPMLESLHALIRLALGRVQKS